MSREAGSRTTATPRAISPAYPLVFANGDPAGLGQRGDRARRREPLGLGQGLRQLAAAGGPLNVSEVRQRCAGRPSAGAVAAVRRPGAAPAARARATTPDHHAGHRGRTGGRVSSRARRANRRGRRPPHRGPTRARPPWRPHGDLGAQVREQPLRGPRTGWRRRRGGGRFGAADGVGLFGSLVSASVSAWACVSVGVGRWFGGGGGAAVARGRLPAGEGADRMGGGRLRLGSGGRSLIGTRGLARGGPVVAVLGERYVRRRWGGERRGRGGRSFGAPSACWLKISNTAFRAIRLGPSSS